MRMINNKSTYTFVACVPSIHVRATAGDTVIDDDNDDSERFLILCRDFGGRWSNFIVFMERWLDLACALRRTLILRQYGQWYEIPNGDNSNVESQLDLGKYLDTSLLGSQLASCITINPSGNEQSVGTGGNRRLNASHHDSENRSASTWPRVISETAVERTVCRSYAIVEAAEQAEVEQKREQQLATCFPGAEMSTLASCGALEFLERQTNQTLLAVHGRERGAMTLHRAREMREHRYTWTILPHEYLWNASRARYHAWMADGGSLGSAGNSTSTRARPRSLGVHFRLGDFQKLGLVDWNRTFAQIEDTILAENITHVSVASNANDAQEADILARLAGFDDKLNVIMCTTTSELISAELSGKAVSFEVVLLDQIWLTLSDVFLPDTSKKSTFSKAIGRWRAHFGKNT